MQEEDRKSEQSGEEDLPANVGPEYTSRNGQSKWNVHCPPRNVRTPAGNLICRLPGVWKKTGVESPIPT